MLSLLDLKTGCYNILREVEGDSSSYPPSLLIDFINNYYFNILTMGVTNIFDGSIIKKMGLPFTESSKFYTNYGQTTLTEDIEVGDTTIFSITNDYPTSGKLYIEGNIVTYTGITDTSFTGVTGLVGNFIAGTVVRFVYDLPVNYSSLIEIIYNTSKTLTIKNYNLIYTELNNSIGGLISTSFGTIIQGKYLVLFNLNNFGDTINLKYYFKPALLSNNTDEIIIPDDIYGNAIKYLAVGEMMYNRGEEQRGKEVFLFGIARVKELYNYYNNQSSKEQNGQRYISGRFNPLNF